MKKITFIISLFSSLALTACMSPKSYTSTEFQIYKQTDLKYPQSPIPINLETEFATNGKLAPKINHSFKKSVIFAFNKTHVVAESSQATKKLKISANNIAGIGGAVANGVKTGLTFGLAGSTVQDNYVMSCSYYEGNIQLSTAEFKHGITSTIGLTSTPKGLVRHSSSEEAFDSVVTDVVINCLGDLQKKGYLLPTSK